MKTAINLNDNIHGTVGGSMATIVASALGLIGAETILEAVIVAMIGATVGYLTNIVIRRVERRIKKWRNG